MKKKLVAFAVTAAMVITSAVPALAWSDDVTKVDYTKNQIVVDKTVNSGGGIVETAVAGGIADSKTFTTTVDLNRIAGQFEYVLGLSTDGKDQKMVKLYVGAGETAGTAVMNLFAADDPYVDADQITVRGIVDITWTFHQNDEGTWVSVAVQERGKTAAQGGYEVQERRILRAYALHPARDGFHDKRRTFHDVLHRHGAGFGADGVPRCLRQIQGQFRRGRGKVYPERTFRQRAHALRYLIPLRDHRYPVFR